MRRRGIEVIAPFKHKSRDPKPWGSAFLGRLRRPIETVSSQLTERYRLRVVKARDQWHLTRRHL